MATLAQIEAALRAADAAGNKEDAAVLAQQYAAMRASPEAAPPQSPGMLGTAWDALRSIPGGLAKGATATLGMGGDMRNLATHGIRAVAGDTAANVADFSMRSLPGLGGFTSGDMNDVISAPTGGFYKPKTGIGRFAETAASFAPAAVGGEGSVLARIGGRVLAPALGATLGGNVASPDGQPSAIGSTVGALAGGILGARNPTNLVRATTRLLNRPGTAERATRYVADLAKAARATPATIAAAPDIMTGAEAIGRPGVTALTALARRVGATPDAAEAVIGARHAAAPDRVLTSLAEASGTHPGAAQGNFDAIMESGRARAAPLYEEAFAGNQNIASPAIDRILETPAGRRAMGAARNLMQNDQSLMGVRDPDLLEQAIEGGTDIPWKGGVASGLKLRSLDYVKRALDDQINAAFRAGNRTEGGILSGLKARLVTALDEADVTARAGPNSTKPGGGLYLQARNAAGDYLRAKDAFAFGQKPLNGIVSEADFADFIKRASASPTTLEALRGGVLNSINASARRGSLRPQQFLTPRVCAKLVMLFGPEKSNALISNLETEAGVSATGSRIKPGAGSPTAEILNAGSEQDQFSNAMTAMDAARGAGHAMHGNIPGMIMSGLRVADRLGAFARTPGMSLPVRDAVGSMLLLPPKELATRLKAFQGAIPSRATSPLASISPPNIAALLASPYIASRTGLFGSNYQSTTQ